MTPEAILQAVADAAYVDLENVTGTSKVREYSYPRHVAIVLLHDREGLPFACIAELLGKRHPTTISQAYWRTLPRLEVPGEHWTLYKRTLASLPAETTSKQECLTYPRLTRERNVKWCIVNAQ